VDSADRRPLGPQTQTFAGVDYRVMAIPLDGREVRIARSLAETETVLGEVRTRSAEIGLVIILLAAVAGVLLARWTSGPVARLTAVAEQIAATGKPGPTPPTGRRDEIGRLARAFVAMLDALTRSRDQQQRLVQDAGHELRTPLTSLRANVDTLRRYPQLDADVRGRVLGDLDRELKELTTLVNEVVALAIDSHDAEEERPVDLAALAEQAADRIERRWGRRVLLRSAPVTVPARPEQVMRAVGNLLENAVKFSPAGTPIELTVTPDRIEVRDYGPGIHPADLPRVFDRFYRADAARSVAGSGLGLSIVQQTAQKWGGTVQAANHPQGGAVFTIQLPPGRSGESTA
jgi:two-component system sensor histidine kinase MprB